jgi:hypothetical protein
MSDIAPGDGDWNSQCASFSFARPRAWRDLTDDELRQLSDVEQTRVWAGATTKGPGSCSLFYVTSCPGELHPYVDLLLHHAWGQASRTTLTGGPYSIDMGGLDGVLLMYSCLDYEGDSANMTIEPRPDGLPDYMTLLLVLGEVNGQIYRAGLYGPESDGDQAGADLQLILDSWIWTELVI